MRISDWSSDVCSSDLEEVLELSDPVPTPKPDAKLASQGRREQILSEQAAQASRGALASLSKLIVKPEIEGSDTLQGMVEDMLRPMLRHWLDAHLPELVEKIGQAASRERVCQYV